jgi:O-antigen/teichoic acid export membrane protein
VLLVFWLVGTFLIEMFGPDYSDAYTTTLIMLSFQLVLAVLGPIGMFAVMSGRQRVIWIAYATAAVLVISGLPLAAKQWGINGAAVMHGFISVLCAAVLCASIWRSVPIGSAANFDGGVRRD